MTATNARLGAEEIYFILDADAAKYVRKLGRTRRPAKRAWLLSALAAREESMANICTDTSAFGGDQNLGRDLGRSAQLLRLVANAARAGLGWDAIDGPLDEDGDPLDYQPAWVEGCVPLLVALSGEAAPSARAGLLDQMHAAVMPHVGAQAAEVLLTLARCERELATRRRWLR